MRVTFPCVDLELEGDLTAPAGCSHGAVICHPHPQYGGDMDNPIVTAVTSALQQAGCATLRFNFRGVGASGGSYGGGVGESDDVRAATRFLVERSGATRVMLAGYSFGAMVALRAGVNMPEVDGLIAVAPPLAFFDLSNLADSTKRKLFIVGDRDQYCSVAQLTEQLGRVAEPKAQRVIAGADHFFAGHEQTVAKAAQSFVASSAWAPP